ncbi:hypothetical protein B0H19DRAFT_1173025 [Mycena capillaripes]|nr:hypothetical protein B0H19DRAFT_1173025 [Mycena capillaripes]
MSSVMYAAAAGIAEDNLHCIFVTSVADSIARRLCASDAEENTLFGDNAMCGASAWAGFSERYRTWERFVKYSRQISRSTSTTVQRIAEMAAQQVVLADFPKFTDRSSFVYVPTPAPEISESVLPELCPTCTASFKAALDAAASDEIHAVEGLPVNVVGCRAVARASTIRRAAIFATEDKCCDVCACRIGCWCDIVSHMVLTALMEEEPTASSTDWVLRCYAVWAVITSSVCVATILSGFDLICDVRQEKGAMGTRDVLDC